MFKKNRCYKIYNKKFYDLKSACCFLVKNYKIFSSSAYNETISLVISHSSKRDFKIKEEKYLLTFMGEKKVLLYNNKNVCFTIGRLGFSVDMIIINIEKITKYIKKLNQERKLQLNRVFLFSTHGPRLELDLRVITI